MLLEEYTKAEDLTSECLKDEDDQLWFENSDGRWIIVTESSWASFTEHAHKYMSTGRILNAIALTKDEWEMEPDDIDEIIEGYEEEIADRYV
jgi:hypothetical protein